jgi:hypothetical protein
MSKREKCEIYRFRKSSITVSRNILNNYKSELLKWTPLSEDIVNKIIESYLDTRTNCALCLMKHDNYNFTSHCDYCGVKFCSLCSHKDTTFVKYISCNIDNCYSCSSGLTCDGETNISYCIPCKIKNNINNNTNMKP